ncbi:MAG: carboxypeptidase regulatory-like domain-containing protein [Bacteroidetes bacterium]|nr:carboxypeptidase regulatory-like domain-containing protein [Bacteroidota bacterium]
MKTLKTLAFILANILCLGAIAQMGSGQIKGFITDEEYKPVIGATVKITEGGVLIGGAMTDENGKYAFKPLNPGIYDVTVMSVEFATTRRTHVEVDPEKTAYVDFKLKPNMLGGEEGIVIEAEYVKPVVDVSVYTMQSINADQFLHMPGDRGDIKQAALNVISDGSQDQSGDVHIRGSRGNATEYIVDGMRVMDMDGIPALSVENVSIITGGIPAQYGDLTSGVIVVTTKDYFGGIRDKHMRETAYRERQERIKRLKEAREMEEKRLKEIEAEKLQEEKAKQEEVKTPQN